MSHVRRYAFQSRDLFVLSAVMVFIAFTAPIIESLNEIRWVRDITGKTPFTVVEVSGILQEYDNTDIVVLNGLLEKHRCVWDFGTAYVINEQGTRFPSIMDVTPEEEIWGGGNRPPSGKAESFGPWLLMRAENFQGNPVGWEAWISHICPEGIQYNFFAEGGWPNATD